MGNDQQTSTMTRPTSRPPLAVRQPRRVEGEPVEAERNIARIETVLASLRPRV